MAHRRDELGPPFLRARRGRMLFVLAIVTILLLVLGSDLLELIVARQSIRRRRGLTVAGPTRSHS